MPTAAELYDAILADPDNLDLRTEYADAIADTDPEHAELIRLQVADLRARRSGSSTPADSQTRIKELTAAIGPRLTTQLAGVSRYELRGGFVGLVRMTAADLLTHGEALLHAHPVQYVELVDAATYVTDLAGFPLLARLTSLDLYGNQIGDVGAATLVESPYLGRIRWLGLAQTGIGASGAEALAAAPTLPSLRYVHFAGNPVALTPSAAAQDWDGTPLEITVPLLGQQLNDRYGPLAWLDPARYAGQWIPDVDEV
jgi:uncharacterized protein (TIGR02996 family)